MFKIVARLRVQKEKIEEFKNTAKELIEKSSSEEGNVFYTLNQDTKDQQKFAFIECWKDEEAMKIHESSLHFTELFPLLTQMTESAGEIDLYEEIEF